MPKQLGRKTIYYILKRVCRRCYDLSLSFFERSIHSRSLDSDPSLLSSYNPFYRRLEVAVGIGLPVRRVLYCRVRATLARGREAGLEAKARAPHSSSPGGYRGRQRAWMRRAVEEIKKL